MRRLTKLVVAAFLVGGSVFGFSVSANAADAPVLDKAELFTTQQISDLTNFIHTADDKYRLVFVVETTPTLSGKDIADYAQERANELGVGNSETNNGVYMLVAPNDRKVQIELGSGVSPVISNQQVTDLISSDVLPHFRDKDWFGGVTSGITRVGDLYVNPAPVESDAIPSNFDWQGFFIWVGIIVGSILLIMVIVFLIVTFFARREAKQELERNVRESQKLNFVKQIERRMLNSDEKDSFEALLTDDEREAAILDLIPGLEQMSGYQENWFPLVQEAYVKARVESVMSRNGVTSKDMLPKKLTGSHESIAAVLAETEASTKRARKRVMKMLEQDRKAREVAARQKAKNEQNAKQFWASLDEEQKSQVKRARSRSDKERVLSSFGADNSNIQVWFPLLLALYATEIGRPQTSSSYSSSSSDSSYRSSDSGSSFSSDFTSFGGGGFDGGGGGGSW